uniref:RNase H type-1 domain-containing protein n=1 Tax=Rhizophagus irregularis (strain DAOM 181602 / DAOM 197198 / MUCL 43194) TaxID=747089 RepID=U9STV3_RHIID
MGSAFLISGPKKFEFNVNITDNPLAFKAELIAIILVLLVCLKDANITIYVDAQAIINIFNQLKKESLQQISRGKRQYNAWWILSFKIIKFFNLTVLLVKVKAHDNSEYNNVVDKLAKEALNNDPVFIDPRLLMYKGNVCWNHNPIEKEVTIMIKHIRETQWIEEFFNLHRNDCWNNSEMLTEIDWSSTFRVLKGNTKLTNFSEHELNSFKVKIWTEELPTLDNLVKRKPHVYSSKWKYPMCLKDKETYTHLWKCEHLGQVNRNVKLADLEHQKGINAKMKKSANKSKLVANKLDKIVFHDMSPLTSR